MSLENILLGAAKTVGAEVVNNVLNSKETSSGESIQKFVEKNLDELKSACNDDSKSKFEKDISKITQTSEQRHSINLINAYGRNKRLGVMVICAVLGLIICLLILTLCRDNLSGEVIGIVSTISGIFGACLKDAYSFEFGSSRGSREKDERLSATLLNRLQS